ncbi:MAG: DUF3089 domain-containing protein [Paludibacteraceae bacterium]|nr:DUF3089 domain-containing protein [Paludibacteraceae bacterium]
MKKYLFIALHTTFVTSIVCLVLFFLGSCQKQPPYQADLFYITSTNVIASQDDDGNEVYNATLTQAEKELLQQEIDFITDYLGDSLNVFAPYYHQFTMNAILLPADSFQKAFDVARTDITQQFKSYLRHKNRNRPFFLVGFSQGAMMIPHLLREMRDKDYKRCLGAYMMGYQLTADDLCDSHIEPATGALEGKVISFNSVTTPDRQWSFVSGGAATCINPLNWTTDATPAVLYYQQDTITIVQDTVAHLLLCDVDPERYSIPSTERWWHAGCLHHWDLLFYHHAIHTNMMNRLRH